MASLLRSLRGGAAARSIASIDDYISTLSQLQFYYQGNAYSLGSSGLTGTYGTERVEEPPNNLEGYVQAAYAANGVVFACLAARMSVFAQMRFQWQRIRGGRPAELFGSSALSLLEEPWPGGTTQDLLQRILMDADLAGNSYWVRDDVGPRPELVRLRPDWFWWVLEPRTMYGGQVGWRRLGGVYWEGGRGSGADPVIFRPSEVMHFAPSPDPLAPYRGMSWLTPVLREVSNDKLMGRHKTKFFENAATPNLSVSLDKEVSKEAFKAFVDKMELSHRGVDQAYKTLFLGGGADVRVIGADFKQMDFKTVQGHGETRIAAAAGVPPIIVGLSEGLESATYSNYGQARRRFADGTMNPLWQNVAGSAKQLIPPPPNPGFDGAVRLWYDSRDVPFLREDRKDAAEIHQNEAATIGSLIQSGFTPESSVEAVTANDWSLLKHSGLVSVQLWPPGQMPENQGVVSPAGKSGAAPKKAPNANQGGG